MERADQRPCQGFSAHTRCWWRRLNHEYQHDKWIGEVRSEAHGRALPPVPPSPFLTVSSTAHLTLDPG